MSSQADDMFKLLELVENHQMSKREEQCLDRYGWEGETFLCQLPPGHKGPHESGNWEWWAAEGPVHVTRFVTVDEFDKGFDEPTRD